MIPRSVQIAPILLAALLLPLPGGVCVAGEDEEPKAAAATEPSSGFRFRPRPLPGCRSYAVFDLGLAYRLNEGRGFSSTDDRLGVSLDLGYMRNLSPENSVGFSVFGLTDERAERAGVRARYRRWLSPQIGADATAGMMLTDNGYFIQAPGLVASVGIQAAGLAGATLEAEQIRGAGGSGSDWDLRLGGHLGAGAGIVGILGIVALGALLIAGYD